MQYSDNSIGPIGQADRDLLVAVANYYCAPLVLEFGSYLGHSAAAWLDGGAAHVTCVDVSITDSMREVAKDWRVELIASDQRAYIPKRNYDIIFFDASHDVQANVLTLQNVQPHLRSRGVLVIHDTGIWAKSAMTPEHERFHGIDLPEGKMHQPGEVLFVDWLRMNGWQCVSLSSRNALRHGITLCQRP